MRRALKLVVDPISCCGEGLCAELFPERISLDPWGYPVVSDEALTPELMEHARRAVDMCPHLAVHVTGAPAPAGAPTRTAGRQSGDRARQEAQLVAQLRNGGRRR